MHVVFRGLIRELIYAVFLLGREKTPLPFTKTFPITHQMKYMTDSD